MVRSASLWFWAEPALMSENKQPVGGNEDGVFSKDDV